MKNKQGRLPAMHPGGCDYGSMAAGSTVAAEGEDSGFEEVRTAVAKPFLRGWDGPGAHTRSDLISQKVAVVALGRALNGAKLIQPGRGRGRERRCLLQTGGSFTHSSVSYILACGNCSP